MAIKFTDNAWSTLTTSIASGTTYSYASSGTITVADGSLFPSVTNTPPYTAAQDYFVITVENAAAQRESFRVANRSGNTFTIVARTYGGGTAIDWAFGDLVEVRITAQGLEDHLAESTTYADLKVAKAGDTMTGFLILHADPDSALKAATKQYVDAAIATAKSAVMPSGSTTLFYSNTAPTGWTKLTTSALDNSALRIVSDGSGSGGNGGVTGGTATFNAVFGSSKSTAGYTLTTSDIPSHNHTGSTASDSGHSHTYSSPAFNVGTGSTPSYFYSGVNNGATTAAGYANISLSIAAQGGGGSHAHALNFDVKYASFIVASKDAY